MVLDAAYLTLSSGISHTPMTPPPWRHPVAARQAATARKNANQPNPRRKAGQKGQWAWAGRGRYLHNNTTTTVSFPSMRLADITHNNNSQLPLDEAGCQNTPEAELLSSIGTPMFHWDYPTGKEGREREGERWSESSSTPPYYYDCMSTTLSSLFPKLLYPESF